jgi:ABC-2 type transport system ATP-binding protein
VNGKPFAELAVPMREVGALLDAKAIHGGRSAYNHLLCLAQTNNLPRRRVDEVLDIVGLSEVAKKRAGSFSLGMGQRLGIAAALLGDPAALVLDEPVNGLDPEGILWIRNLMKSLAAEGRAVFVSSHLMNEMAVTADHLIVIGRGRLVADCSTEEFIERSTERSVLVRTPDGQQLAELLTRQGATVTRTDDGDLDVTGIEAPRIAELAAAEKLVLHELSTRRGSLEEAFMELTKDAVEYDAGLPAAGGVK